MQNKIEVIGLGSGDLDQLPLGIYKKIKAADAPIWIRTKDHPVITQLSKEGMIFQSFDAYYEQETTFAEVYERIVETLITSSKEQPVIYAVPGHPMLAEQTVQLLLEQTEVPVEVLGGQSYLDDLFTSLKVDPIDGFQFMDGTSFTRSQLNYDHHIIFCQVYDRYVASEVKLTLLEDLPADYPVIVVEAAGSVDEVLTTVPLQEIDRSIEVSNLTSIYVPPVPRELLNHTFDRLREVIATLRGPDGCPWDQAQTHETLREYFIEEVYEVIDAIDAEDDEAIIEELGDVLLQVMLHGQIGEEAGYFTVSDVIQGITNKMIYRHPHVFHNSTGDPTKSWDELKSTTKDKQDESMLSNITKALPSLTKAYKLQKKAAKVGFGWDDVNDIWLKFDEELGELKAAIEQEDVKEIEKELGDVLFVLANLGRHYQINPEVSLNLTNKKFMTRFAYIEQKLVENGKGIQDSSLEEMDYYWDQAKRKED